MLAVTERGEYWLSGGLNDEGDDVLDDTVD